MSELEAIELFTKHLHKENKPLNTIKAYTSVVTRFFTFVNQVKGNFDYNKDDVISFLMKQFNDGMSKSTLKNQYPPLITILLL